MNGLKKTPLVAAAFLSIVGLTLSPSATAQQKPNIVMLMTDDTGFSGRLERAAL